MERTTGRAPGLRLISWDGDRLARPLPRSGYRAGVSRFPVGGGVAEVYEARVRQVASILLHRRGRLVPYGVYTLSVMRFAAQVAPTPQAALTAEQGAIAQLLRCPMHAIGPAEFCLSCRASAAALPFPISASLRKRWRCASRRRMAEEIAGRIQVASNPDEAILVPFGLGWRAVDVW